MSDHEILLELLDAKNRLERQRKIELIVAVVLIAILAAALIFAWTKVSATMQKVEESLVNVNAATEKIQELYNGLQEAGLENPGKELGETLKELHDGAEKINEVYDQLSNVKETVREAIQQAVQQTLEQGFGQSIEQGVEQGVEQGMDALESARDWLTALFG